MPQPLAHAFDTLEGRFVRLEPLTLVHCEGLVAAASEDRSTYGLTFVPDGPEAMREYVERAIALRANGQAVPYATVRREDGRIVGSTRFGNVERWDWPAGNTLARPESIPDAIEIGWTWLAGSAQRTAVNTEAKLLMLGLAFERWRVHRVTLKTDVRNARSRANIERIGGTLDGVWRAQTPAADGGIRDTVFYSIVASEWTHIRNRLESKLDRDASLLR